jgi:hypothetical protein
VYRFDRRTGQIMMEDSLRGECIRRDSLRWEKECYDALGLLMHSRRLGGSGDSVSLPTLNESNSSKIIPPIIDTLLTLL